MSEQSCHECDAFRRELETARNQFINLRLAGTALSSLEPLEPLERRVNRLDLQLYRHRCDDRPRREPSRTPEPAPAESSNGATILGAARHLQAAREILDAVDPRPLSQAEATLARQLVAELNFLSRIVDERFVGDADAETRAG